MIWRQFIMEWLDPIGVIIGLIVSVPVFWTWWQVVFGERRAQRRWLREIAKQTGERPGVLVIDCLPEKNIEASVRKALAKKGLHENIPDNRFCIVRRDKLLRSEDTAGLASDLRQAVRRLLDAGVDVVHLFHGGPDVSALLAGAELSNGPRVLIYHYDQGDYHCFGPLEPLRFR